MKNGLKTELKPKPTIFSMLDLMFQIKNEVQQVVEMMREYLSKSGHGTNSAYNDLLNSFSKRFTLHKNQDDINSDLQNLLDSLGNLQV